MADIVCKDDATRQALKDLLYAAFVLVTDTQPIKHRNSRKPVKIANLEAAYNRLADLCIGKE